MRPVARLKVLPVVISALALGAVQPAAAAVSHHKAAKPAKAEASGAPVQIELVQHLGPQQAAALQEIVDRFNAGSRDKLVVSDRAWDKGELPTMMILGDDEDDRFLAGKARYKPLYQVMKEGGEPLKGPRVPAFINPVSVDAKGQLRALPVGLSTPVIYYNREVFAKAGLNPDNPPRTWMELQDAIGHMVDAGERCPYTVSQPARVMIENTSSWHNEPVENDSSKQRSLSINGMLQIKHIAMMASWYRSSYLRIFGHGEEAEQRFASGECAIVAAPSASWPALRKEAKFDIGVSSLPYHDDVPGAPQNTVADGPALWVANGKDRADYKVVARFIKFWLSPENQIAWQRGSGYLPLSKEGLLATNSDLLAPDLSNIRVAVAELTHRPTTSSSRAVTEMSNPHVRSVINEELDAVWADTKPAKAALDDAVARLRGFN